MTSFDRSRRGFLRAVTGASLFGSPLSYAVGWPLSYADGQPAASVGERCYRDFRTAVKSAPWLEGFRSIDVDALPPMAMTIDGKLPPGLSGTLYRNGPAGFERSGVRYQHWFDGDGMIQAFRLSPTGIVHHARKVQTQKLIQERKAGRFLYGGAGSRVPQAVRTRDNETTNPANISVVPYEGDLLALWEAGSAYALDPKTLDTRRRVVWSPQTDRLPFAAHPIVDPDGTMWNFGLAQWVNQGVLILYQIRRGQGLVQSTSIPLPFAGYLHSFASTARWLLFFLSPNVLDRTRKGSYVARHQWQPELGGRFLLVDKADLSHRRWIEAPAGMVFHFGGAKDEPDGSLSCTLCWGDDAQQMNDGMAHLLCGSGPPLAAMALVRVHIPPRGMARFERYDINGEFPIVDRRFQSSRHDRLFLTRQTGRSRWLDAIASVELSSGRVQEFRFPAGHLVEEHVFVPRRSNAREGDGWLVGTSFNTNRRRTELTVFDTQSIANGPQLWAHMPRSLPLGFHGWFASSS